MPKSPSGNNIQPENVSVEEEEWVSVSVAVPHSAKPKLKACAERQGLKLSVWGRKVLLSALENERRTGEDRRSA